MWAVSPIANGHGGLRRPANPAMVSGPGALSARTDGGPGQPVPEGPSGLPYGEGATLKATMQGAPMADTSDRRPQIIPLDADSQFPDEPITAGAPFGPGPGPSPQQSGRLTDLLSALLGDDIVGGVEELYLEAERLGL